MSAKQQGRRTPRPPAEQPDEAIGVPTTIDAPVVDPPAVEAAAPAPLAERRVQAIRNENSVSVGAAHFSLRAGQILTLEGSIADELIRRRLAKEV